MQDFGANQPQITQITQTREPAGPGEDHPQIAQITQIPDSGPGCRIWSLGFPPLAAAFGLRERRSRFSLSVFRKAAARAAAIQGSYRC
jgi:hypothetical protein